MTSVLRPGWVVLRGQGVSDFVRMPGRARVDDRCVEPTYLVGERFVRYDRTPATLIPPLG